MILTASVSSRITLYESVHGVTWHVMTSRVDAGDILQQAVFPVDEQETTLSLNLKCHEYALETFSRLVEELAAGTYRRTPQDLSRRTYFAADRKCAGAGLISLGSSAAEIDRLWRALDFGTAPNRMGRGNKPASLMISATSSSWR